MNPLLQTQEEETRVIYGTVNAILPEFGLIQIRNADNWCFAITPKTEGFNAIDWKEGLYVKCVVTVNYPRVLEVELIQTIKVDKISLTPEQRQLLTCDRVTSIPGRPEKVKMAWEWNWPHFVWNKWNDSIINFQIYRITCGDHSPGWMVNFSIFNLQLLDFGRYNIYHEDDEKN